MGSYLGSPQSTLQPLARGPPHQRPGLTPTQKRVHRGHCVRTQPFPQMLPDRRPPKPPRVVAEARTCPLLKAAVEGATGPDLSCAWEGCMRRTLASPWRPRGISSPVTIKIAPPERRGSFGVPLAQGDAAAEERPDPCAKETVLRALRQCRKGNRKFDGPLWFEIPEDRGGSRSPGPRPSAFQPLARNGVAPPFVPQPGPLHRSLCSWMCPVREAPDRGSAAGPAMGTAALGPPEPPVAAPKRWH